MTTLFMNISGKVALITGASKRIGRAAAIELASRGARIGIHYRSSRKDAEETLSLVRKAGGDGHLVRAELTRLDETAAMIDETAAALDGLHILINNASVFVASTPEKTRPEDWDAQMESNA